MTNEQGPVVDEFDRMAGALEGLPGSLKTKPTSIVSTTQMTGNTNIFTVYTIRYEGGDTVMLTRVTKDRTDRIAIPPAVANAIARQRDALTKRARSKAAKATAQARKDRGELPGFMKKVG